MRPLGITSFWLVICVAVCTSVLRVNLETVDRAILRHAYGQERVAREHLRIVRDKPELVVSNGDVLPGLTFRRYLMIGVPWLAISFVGLALTYRFALPKPNREQLLQGNNRVSAPALLWVLALFFLVPGWLPLGWALTFGSGSALLGVVWARKAGKQAPSN